MSGDWKNLIKLGKIAERDGIDFYYLKVRMGIAYYNRKNYRQAIPYLEKALIDSPNDEFVLEYLYYAYIYSGEITESRKLAYKITEDSQKRLKISNGTGFSGIELGTKFDSWDGYKVESTTSDTIQQAVQQNYNYFGFNTEFNLKKGAKLDIGFSRIGVSEDEISLDSDNILTKTEREIGQNQLYMSLLTSPSKGLELIFSTNFLIYSFNEESTNVSTTSTLKAGFGPGSGSGGSISNNSYNAGLGNNLSVVAHMGIYKDFSFFKAGVFSSVANLNGDLQLQPGFSLYLYPFGNTNLYTVSSLTYLFEKFDDSNYSEILLKQSLGVNLFGLYIEPAYTFGELYNAIEGNGYIINNCNDIIRNRKELLAYTFLFKGRLNLFFKYQKYERINYYLINDITQTINYQYQSIIGGIKWNF